MPGGIRISMERRQRTQDDERTMRMLNDEITALKHRLARLRNCDIEEKKLEGIVQEIKAKQKALLDICLQTDE